MNKIAGVDVDAYDSCMAKLMSPATEFIGVRIHPRKLHIEYAKRVRIIHEDDATSVHVYK